MSASIQHVQSPLAELRAFLRSNLERFQARRLLGPVAREEVAIDIAADAIAHSNALARSAHSAETHDLEALRIFGRVLADGRIDASELPALRAGCAMVKRSAEIDHDISERAHVAAAS